jgi:type II secretory ATPase GspE/PulE/Tfp pilus assembly ATPase PilB-like protein
MQNAGGRNAAQAPATSTVRAAEKPRVPTPSRLPNAATGSLSSATPTAQTPALAKQRRTDPVVITELRDVGDDRVFRPLIPWCLKEGGEICVMSSGRVLYARANSRQIANLRALIKSKYEQELTNLRLTQAGHGLISKLLEDARTQGAQTAGEGQPSHEELSQARQRLRTIIAAALERRVSDVHFEIRQRETILKFRRFGMLEEYERWPSTQARAIAAAAFNFDTDQSDGHLQPTRPQDASMSIDVSVGGQTRTVRMRVGTGPVSQAGGGGTLDHLPFDMVLRILQQGSDEKPVTLGDLGYTQSQRQLIERSVTRPHGMILVCGPTGSGKSTTLAACIATVEPHRKIFTVEDPVEKLLPNASQMPVEDSKQETTFAGLVKATMRLDPDVLMVGEVRDEETAENMVRAAITGHLVLSTLHVSGVTKVVPRLQNLRVSREILANPDVLELLIYQRLVPLLCTYCRLPIEVEAYADQRRIRDLLEIAGSSEGVYMRNPKGCAHCDRRGVAGRSVVAEVLPIDDRGREFIQKGDMLSWERDLIGRGWHTIADHALMLVRQGRVDLLHAQEAAGFRTANEKEAINFTALYERAARP